MKLKVKGLVFVGFAAAVFASSAMATIAEPSTEDKKVVASKYYVDSNFQDKSDRVTVAPAANSDDWNDTATYPSMAVLKAKFDALTPAVGSNATDYVDFSESGDTLTVNFDNAPATAAADLTGYDASTAVNGATLSGAAAQKLVTTGAVNSMILRENNGATTIDSGATNGTVPTSKNVYDFVTGAISTAGADYQPKLESTDDGDLYVGQYDSDSTWKRLDIANASGQNPALASTNYVAKTVSGGVYTVNLDSTQVGTAGTDVAASSTKLATGNAVYEYVQGKITTTTEGTIANSTTDDVNVPTIANVYNFVTNYASDTYQVKNTTDAPMVGYGNAWRQLTASGTTGASGNTYVVMQSETDSVTNAVSYKLNLASASIANSGTDISSSTVGNAAANDYTNDLTTAKAVKEYVASQVDTQFALGTNPCNAANSAGHYCALVAYYDADTANGGANAGVKYEWTVMAPTGN